MITKITPHFYKNKAYIGGGCGTTITSYSINLEDRINSSQRISFGSNFSTWFCYDKIPAHIVFDIYEFVCNNHEYKFLEDRLFYILQRVINENQ